MAKKLEKIYPWIVVALLWVVALLNYMDRQMLSTMREYIAMDIAELQSAEAFGVLMGIFLWIYAIVSPFAGRGEDSGIDLHTAGVDHREDGLAALRKAGFDGLMCQDFEGIYRNQRHASTEAKTLGGGNSHAQACVGPGPLAHTDCIQV